MTISDSRQQRPSPQLAAAAGGQLMKDHQHRRSDRPRSQHHQASPHRGQPPGLAPGVGAPNHHHQQRIPPAPSVQPLSALQHQQQRKHSAPVVLNGKPEVRCYLLDNMDNYHAPRLFRTWTYWRLSCRRWADYQKQ